MNHSVLPTVVLLAGLASACAGSSDSRAPGEAVVRDSAGVRIVQNGEPARVDEWTLEPLPVASIGEGMGDPALELYEVTGVLLQADGSIVIANSGTHEVRFYSASGDPHLAVGREGEGPGEFQGEIQLANMPGDSVLAFDWALRRATVLDRSGAVARTIDLRPLDPNVDLRGVMADGCLLFSMRHLQLSEGENEDSVVFVRTDSRGAPIDWLGWEPLTRVVLRYLDGPPVIDEIPFGPHGYAAAAGEGLVVTDGERAEWVLRGDGGVPVLIARWAATPLAITRGTIDRFLEWDGSIRRDWISPATRKRWLESIEYPAFAPATAGLVTDPHSGFVLVQSWSPPWRPGDAAWLVFASDGRLIATLRVPPGLDLIAASGDRVAGLERDAMGVEHVRVYRVES